MKRKSVLWAVFVMTSAMAVQQNQLDEKVIQGRTFKGPISDEKMRDLMKMDPHRWESVDELEDVEIGQGI